MGPILRGDFSRATPVFAPTEGFWTLSLFLGGFVLCFPSFRVPPPKDHLNATFCPQIQAFGAYFVGVFVCVCFFCVALSKLLRSIPGMAQDPQETAYATVSKMEVSQSIEFFMHV